LAAPLDLPVVPGDEALLHAAVRNLIDNAVRHGRSGGEVELRVTVEDGRVALSILDRGPGMPEALIDRAGERFFRVPGTSVDGAGLGLSLVRRIADLHGGALIIANRQDGAGLQATIHLPASGA
jgi:signal transduction histidine kinase